MTSRLVPERQLLSQKQRAAEARMWRLASHVRGREGWLADTAHVIQRWTIHDGRERIRFGAHVSFFLDLPTIVFGIAFEPAKSAERLVEHPWLRQLHARLGNRYRVEDHRPERPSIVRVLRGTTDPARALAELDMITAAVEGGAVQRRNVRARYTERKTPAQRASDAWTILEALTGTAWSRPSIHQTIARNVRHDGCAWLVRAGLDTFVTKGRPEIRGSFFGASSSARRLGRATPMKTARALLRDSGYDHRAPEFSIHGPTGNDLHTLDGEVALLERAMTLVDVRKSPR